MAEEKISSGYVMIPPEGCSTIYSICAIVISLIVISLLEIATISDIYCSAEQRLAMVVSRFPIPSVGKHFLQQHSKHTVLNY